jgi:hypothetical protein
VLTVEAHNPQWESEAIQALMKLFVALLLMLSDAFASDKRELLKAGHRLRHILVSSLPEFQPSLAFIG